MRAIRRQCESAKFSWAIQDDVGTMRLLFIS